MTPPEYPADLLARAARIRLIGFDVDGTLTDGGLLLDADGRETRRFDVQDGMGLVLLGRAGITVALVTARHGEAVRTRGKELGITRLHLGERDKLARMQAIATELGIGMEAVAFMGDDLPDRPVMLEAGLALAPANAHPWTAQAAHWMTPRPGGHGAVRDACDLLLHAQGHVAALLVPPVHG